MVGYIPAVFSCSVGQPDVFVTVCQGVDPVFLDPALGVEGGDRCFVEMLSVDLVAFASENIHAVLECNSVKEEVLVVLGRALCLFDVFVALH